MVYATDGMGSPEPELKWRDRISPDLGEVRRQEARDAMSRLGLPPANVHFLDLPDGRLRLHHRQLWSALKGLFQKTGADRVLVPFRFDRHPDHLAVNRVVTRAVMDETIDVDLLEFFVYHHWRLLPGGDVRRFLPAEALSAVDISAVSELKLEALSDFRSQITRFYPWQSRPNLTPILLDQVSRAPEIFLRFDRNLPGPRILRGPVPWILVAHRLEPLLKRRKDRCLAIAKRLLGIRPTPREP